MTTAALVPPHSRRLSIAILAMGGEGGGVLADWLVDLAEHHGYWAQTTSVPGVAQRTGATLYYLELYPQAADSSDPAGLRPVLALSPFPGDVDIVLASELMEAGRAIQRNLVDPEKTTLIASTHRVYSMTERTAMGDGRVDDAKLLSGAQAAALRFFGADFAQLAEQHGSVIGAALFGALAGSACLPFSRAQFEATISRGGVGVSASLKAFAAGFDAVTAAAPTPPSPEPERPLKARVGVRLQHLAGQLEAHCPAAAQGVVASGLIRLVDYQSEPYAATYAGLLRELAHSLSAARIEANLSDEIFTEAARHLALWMTYEDVVRVADLKTRRTRFQRVSQEVRQSGSQLVDIHEFLHPRLEEIADILPAGLGRWLLAASLPRKLIGRFTSRGRVVQTNALRGFLLLYALASCRVMRPVSLRFQVEWSRIHTWWQLALSLLPQHPELSLELLRLQRLIKGYGATHARGVCNFEKILAALPQLMTRQDAPQRLAAWCNAALADESGAALDQALRSTRIDTAPTSLQT